MAGAGRHGRSRHAGPGVSSRDRCLRAAGGHRSPVHGGHARDRRGGRLRRRGRALCFGGIAGGASCAGRAQWHYPAGQGLALHAHGARRRRAHRRSAGGRAALMLLWLTEILAKEVRAFNVFGYLTLRAVLATMTALIISFVVGPKMILWLTRMKIGQAVRDDGPKTHLTKA